MSDPQTPEEKTAAEKVAKNIAEAAAKTKKIKGNVDAEKTHTVTNTLGDTGSVQFALIAGLLGAWSWQLLPGHVTLIMDTNRWAQLVVLYIVCVTSLSYFGNATEWWVILLKSLGAMVAFLLISKQHIYSFSATVALLAAIAFLKNSHERQVKDAEDLLKAAEAEKETDKKMSGLKKADQKTKSAQGVSTAITVVTIVTTVLVCVGVAQYGFKKYKAYGQSEDALQFMFKFLFEKGSKGSQSTTPILQRSQSAPPDLSRDPMSWNVLDRSNSAPEVFYKTNPMQK